MSYLKQYINCADVELNQGHSNKWKSRGIALIFSRLGYNVDIINWKDTSFVPEKINKFSILLTIADSNNNEISGTKTEMKDINKSTYIFEFIEDKIRYNWGDYFISLHIFSGHNCITEFNRISRISFINKMIKEEVHYGGYLLNQMKTKKIK